MSWDQDQSPQKWTMGTSHEPTLLVVSKHTQQNQNPRGYKGESEKAQEGWPGAQAYQEKQRSSKEVWRGSIQQQSTHPTSQELLFQHLEKQVEQCCSKMATLY
jgi:hypothetical protein